VKGLFPEIGSGELFAQAGFLLISVSQVARIIGVSHLHLAENWGLSKLNSWSSTEGRRNTLYRNY
jgi:hypothetical protein